MTDRQLWTESAEDLYRALGVDSAATPERIRQAWHRKARTTHPDIGGDLDRFRSIHIAYLVLSDPEQRARYDRHRLALRGLSDPGASGSSLQEPAPPLDLNTSRDDPAARWGAWVFILVAIAAVVLAYIWPPSSILTGMTAITVVVTRYVHHWRERHPTL
jgi:DnaJ domain